jgi:hypothetical protein
MISAEDWVALAPWVAIAAATFSLGSCVIAYRVSGTHARVADFNNCFEILKQLREAVRSAHDAQGDTQEHAITLPLSVLTCAD